jgi:hypothetical protein
MLKDHLNYIRPLSPDEIYTRQLEALVLQLKLLLCIGTPFVTSADYACKVCQGRIKLHQDERWYCLRCVLQPGAASPRWTEATRERIVEIMAGYPEEAVENLVPPKNHKARMTYHDRSVEKVAFGARVEEARQARGWSQEELAAKIMKKDGNPIS